MKCLKIDQDNLRMKFSDFSSPSADPLGSRRPAHASVKERYSSKKWLFYWYCLVQHENSVADRHRHPAYDNKH